MCAQRVKKNGPDPKTRAVKKTQTSSTADERRITRLGERKRRQLRDYRGLLHTDPDGILKQILNIGVWAGKNKDTGLLAKSMVYAAGACLFADREDEAEKYLQEAENLLPDISDQSERSDILHMMGEHYITLDDWKTGLNNLRQSLELARAIGKPEKELGGLYQSMATGFIKAGAFEEALEYSLLYYGLMDRDIASRHGQALIDIGSIYSRLRDYPKAMEYYHQGLTICGDGRYDEGFASCLLNTGICLLEQDKPADALPYLENAEKRLCVLGHTIMLAESLCSQGRCHVALGNTEEAINYYNQAIEITGDAGNSAGYAFALGKKGKLLLNDGKPDAALVALLEALEASSACNQPEQDIELHRQLARVYELMGDFRQSSEHQKKVFDLYKSIVGVERQQAIATMGLRYSMLAARKEHEILQLRAEKAEQDSELKTRELSAVAMQLTQRNEALKTLQKIVDPYVKEGKGQTKQLASTVKKNIMAAVDTHAEWRVFEEQFERVHQDFIRTLKTRCPELTPTELRICVLIRLNLSSKQIADTLFTSLLTVKTHRVNIRRKLRLGEDNLVSFLMTI